ncbi:MAG: ABC transporter permease [Anaerolineales bacterium]|nr:ABC transporter permease [Anaerolineales bacterium]
MNKILAIAFKDNFVRFSSPGEWLFFLVLPVIFSVVIGLATGAQTDSRIALLVVDQDGGELARDLIDVLQDSKTVAVREYLLSEAEEKFRERQAPAMLVIPAGLAEAQAGGEEVELQFTEAAGNVDAVAARQAVQAALGSLGRALQAAGVSLTAAAEIRPFADQAARDAFFQDGKDKAAALFADQPERILVTGPAQKAEEDFWRPNTQASAGTIVTWVFIPLLAISEFFALERQLGTLRRMLSAPVSKAVYLLGTITGQLGTALLQMLILAGFGTLLLGVSWWHDLAATLTIFLAFGLASVAFGTMLGTFVKTQGQASGLSLALGMSMALLGGCWYPLELFPEFVQKAVLVLPTTWAMMGMNDIVLRGQGLAAVLPEAGALLGFAVVFFTVGVLRFRYE